MPFYLPSFNLAGNGWTIAGTPNAQPVPEWEELAVQLYIESRQPGRGQEFQGNPQQPCTTVVRFTIDLASAFVDIWIWEIPAGSHNYYKVFYKEIMHQGFPNQYHAHFVTQCDGDGTAVARYL